MATGFEISYLNKEISRFYHLVGNCDLKYLTKVLYMSLWNTQVHFLPMLILN